MNPNVDNLWLPSVYLKQAAPLRAAALGPLLRDPSGSQEKGGFRAP